ncbi:hypothetical protein VTI74DRAFT_2673 [Chaetomium olivicolor]
MQYPFSMNDPLPCLFVITRVFGAIEHDCVCPPTGWVLTGTTAGCWLLLVVLDQEWHYIRWLLNTYCGLSAKNRVAFQIPITKDLSASTHKYGILAKQGTEGRSDWSKKSVECHQHITTSTASVLLLPWFACICQVPLSRRLSVSLGVRSLELPHLAASGVPVGSCCVNAWPHLTFVLGAIVF